MTPTNLRSRLDALAVQKAAAQARAKDYHADADFYERQAIAARRKANAADELSMSIDDEGWRLREIAAKGESDVALEVATDRIIARAAKEIGDAN